MFRGDHMTMPQGGSGGSGQPQSYRGNHCQTCNAPISPYSRGKCRPCGYIGLKRDVPEDFLIILRLVGSQGAARHFYASLGTVTRWRREIGLVPQERARKSLVRAMRSRGFQEVKLIVCRDFTLPGQAASFLRRFGAVYRCDLSGKPNAKGSHWKRNFSVLDDGELMDRAKRLGWTEQEF
jgi:hypothetical protein